MKNTIAFVFIILLGTACSNSTSNVDTAFTDLSTEQFRDQMSQKNTVILDVRTLAEVQEGSIPGAIHIDIHSDQFEAKIEQLDKSKNYLVYCQGGTRSAKACNIMSEKGFKDLYNLENGYKSWK